MKGFKQFIEEDISGGGGMAGFGGAGGGDVGAAGSGGGGGAPANNSEATKGIDKYPTLFGKKMKGTARRKSQGQIVGSAVRIPDTPSHG